MPKINITPEELKGYFSGELKHSYYKDTLDQRDAMLVHADGTFPDKLLSDRRPNEPEEVFAYRKKIFIPKTKPVYTKIFNSLSKIRRAADWSIRYENIDEFTRIPEEESLETYCEKDFPYFTSITNWVFQVLLREYLNDPNAVMFTYPLETDVEETALLRPYPTIFESVDVFEYVQEDFAILNNPMGAVYYVRNKPAIGKSIYFITTLFISRFDQINGKGDVAEKLKYEHQLGILPVEKIRAVIKKSVANNYLYESRIAPIIPELDEAIREYSDLQASKVLHIYPERWEFTQHECPTCQGSSKIANPRWHEGCAGEITQYIDCTNKNCTHGLVSAGPYSKIMIRPVNSALENTGSIPAPPAGYVEKDIEIVRIQDEGVEKHIVSALAAINFEFLAKTPLSESGVAKEVDKDELNNTVHSIAEDIVRVMDTLYKTIAFYRYKVQYSLEEIEERMLPVISVPEKFDILSSTHLEQELASAKTNKVNSVLLNAMEIDYAKKKFNADPKVHDRLKLVLELDPLPNISEDDKMSRLSNKGITLESYVISSNVHEFVQNAIEENPEFPGLDLVKQKEKMKAYAKVLIDQQDEARKMAKVVTMETGIEQIPGQKQPIMPEVITGG